MNILIRTSVVLFNRRIVIDSIHNAVALVFFLTSMICAAPPDGGAVDHFPDENIFRVYILPNATGLPDVGEAPFLLQTTPTIISGAPFSVSILITDAENRRVNVSGHFKFSWSNLNYVNPANPPVRLDPFHDNRSYQIRNGLTVINNLCYHECGRIKLTGTAKIQLHGPGGNVDVDGESHSFIVCPYQFLLQSQLPAVPVGSEGIDNENSDKNVHGQRYGNQNRHGHGDDEEGEDSVLIAGTPFSLHIYAINANGRITNNYPYDDAINESQSSIDINIQVVEPENGAGGELRDENNHLLNNIPKTAFQLGECELATIIYTDVGIINLEFIDRNYMGCQIVGRLDRIGRFIPDHFAISVEQPAMMQTPETSYTYSGQPFAATVTITAKNALNPPETTENFVGQIQEHQLSVSLPPHQAIYGKLQTPSLSSATFTEGSARFLIEPLIFTFFNHHEPQPINIRYAFDDQNGAEGSTDSSPVEFRFGRIRIMDVAGSDGDFLKLLIDAEYFQAGEWQLNPQEERLRITRADLQILDQIGSGTVRIVGAGKRFFGGKIRGGKNPLRLESTTVSERMQFSVTLHDNSPLRFLPVIPARCLLSPSIGSFTGYPFRERVLYEKRI
jgi:hypothetical protein